MASKDPASTSRKAATKSPKVRASSEDKEQSARFIETARELEVDESGKAFDRAVKLVLPKR